jgi:hypothetical protein
VAILTAETDAEVVGRLLARLNSPAMQAALEARAVDTADSSAVAELQRAEDRMAELAAEYAAGTITRGEWQAARGVLAERIAAAEGATGTRRPTRLPANVAASWPVLDLETRRAILADWVESVTIEPAVRGRTVFDPDRIAITWRA